MLVSFELTMPSNNSWNGKWSREDELHVIVRSLKTIPVASSYGYDFGDGWRARIYVNPVTAAEARRLRKKSKGFCGYEWMIDSILKHGEIKL